MSGPNDQPDSPPATPRPPRRHRCQTLWRGAGGGYLIVCLAGVAVGLWPHIAFGSQKPPAAAPLPTLRTLAVAQVGFILLVYPLVTLARAQRAPLGGYWPTVLAESALLLVVGVPFYLAAAFLADAAAADVVRTVLAVTCIWPVAWLAGAHLAHARAGRSVVMLAMVLVAIGLPAAFYIAWDILLAHRAATLLWHVAPATFVWQAAGSRVGSVLPRPLWSAALWPAAAAAAGLGAMLRGVRH